VTLMVRWLEEVRRKLTARIKVLEVIQVPTSAGHGEAEGLAARAGVMCDLCIARQSSHLCLSTAHGRGSKLTISIPRRHIHSPKAIVRRRRIGVRRALIRHALQDREVESAAVAVESRGLELGLGGEAEVQAAGLAVVGIWDVEDEEGRDAGGGGGAVVRVAESGVGFAGVGVDDQMRELDEIGQSVYPVGS
jgi:hypothetical protein